MKAVTRGQWDRMNLRQRSWLINHLMGGPCRVYWHCVDPAGKIVGGSYAHFRDVFRLIQMAKNLTAEEAKKMGLEFPHPLASCRAKPILSYAHAAEYDHIALQDLKKVFVGPRKKHLTIKMVQDGDKLAVGVYVGRENAFGSSLAEAGCLMILKYFGCFQED